MPAFKEINLKQKVPSEIIKSSNTKRIKASGSTETEFSKSSFYMLIFLSSLFLFLISCFDIGPPINNTTPKARVLLDKTDETEAPRSDREESRDDDDERRSRSSCRDSRSRVISFTGDLDFVDSVNVGNYELKGRCEERNQAVKVKVNGYRVSEDPACSRGRWELELDLSSIASAGKEIIFEVNHNDETACKKVLVGFLGPKNYIPVPAYEDHYESSFYVMKYEAKLENERSSSAKAVSKPEESPINRISHNEALKLCRNNGPRYDLIRNSQWQNIALSIEETDINWSNGRRSLADDNALNCGISLGRAKPASTDDRDDCADSSCRSQWDFKRRTHILSNGQIIWDICGNVGEIMKDKYTLGDNFQGHVFDLTGRLKNLFGPDRTYRTGSDNDRSSRDNLYWGLGKADIESDHDLIVRGAAARTGSGIFSVSVTSSQDSSRAGNQLGFRCIYIP